MLRTSATFFLANAFNMNACTGGGLAASVPSTLPSRSPSRRCLLAVKSLRISRASGAKSSIVAFTFMIPGPPPSRPADRSSLARRIIDDRYAEIFRTFELRTE